MSEYRNDQGQLDTYFRVLPRTDDPVECIEHLLSWWQSKREAQASLAGGEPIDGSMDEDWNESVARDIIGVEEEAIERLLDALTGTEPVADVPSAESALLAAAELAERTIRLSLPTEAVEAIKADHKDWDAIRRTRIALEEAIEKAEGDRG